MRLLILSALTALVIASCPENCHNNGECHHDVCTCNEGYAGDDCSISITPLRNRVAVEDSLTTFTWKYYSMSLPTDVNALNITVHQLNSFGDVDVFVQKGRLPTRSDNMASDVSTATITNLLVQPSPPGTYYIGCYAYFYVEYSIMAEMLNTCTVDCGEHGECAHNQCACYEGYAGEQCEFFDMELSSNAVVEGSVLTGEFQYYHHDVPADSNFDLVVSQDSSSNCDIDVYIRRETYPSLFAFDQSNVTTAQVTEVHLSDLEAGLWFIGIYGYRGCGYVINFVVSPRTACLSECSAHGSCHSSHNTCTCDRGFSGDYCETMDDGLTDGSQVDGHVDAGYWNYYHFQITSQNAVNIHVRQADSLSDCDVFVASNRLPSQVDYEYADTGYSQEFDVQVNNPSTATWNIGVFGWSDCSYSLTLSMPTHCPCVMGHGHCEAGSSLCMCLPGYTGPSCEQSTNSISNGQVLDDEVEPYEWAYYAITANTSLMLISMRERGTEGNLWLFASMSGFPQLDAYDVMDKNTNTDFHEVHYLFQSRELRTFFIGVYGSPFAHDEVPFSITAWYPDL